MRTLSKKEIKELNEKIGKELFSKKDLVTEEDEIYFFENEALFFTSKDKIVPTIRFLLRDLYLPTVTVDMGAVRFVVKGADIMRPGITACDPGLEKGNLVAIVDETHGKPLAVGRLLLSSGELLEATEGKVVETIHYVGDALWHKK